MRELAKASFNFSWALSLFGAQQVVRLVAAPRAAATKAEFYAVAQAAQDQFGDLVWAAFQVGDEWQRDTVDLFFDVATLRAFTPSSLARRTGDWVAQAQETGRVLLVSSESRLAWAELKNKYEVYNLVKQVRTLLDIPTSGAFPLAELIEKAYALGAYPDLWAVEGLGHDYALSRWQPPQKVRGLLTEGPAQELPDKSLTMMHAGIGLAFAQQLLKTVAPFGPADELRSVLQQFVTLCRANSRTGYTGAAFESLGLVARTWHAPLVGSIDQALRQLAPEVVSFFWHGAGRALYFLPSHFVPGLSSPWRAAEREAPHELARLNLLAGLAWATTLVNLRQPEIMANLLRQQGDELARNQAFSNGVLSSLMMGYDITPGDIYIREFCRAQPDTADAMAAERWQNSIVRPCAVALQQYYPALKQRQQLEELFHYQPLAA